MLRRTSVWLFIILVLSVAAVSAAWVSQYTFGMQPCPWCILQRVVFCALAAMALLGLLLLRVQALLIVFGVVGSLVSLSGAAAALYQHFVAASQVSCNLTLADKIVGAMKLDTLWPAMFSATASCADAAVRLAGVPYEFFSLLLFVLLAGAWVVVAKRA